MNKAKGGDFAKMFKALVDKYNERKEQDLLVSNVLEDFTDEIIALYEALKKEKESYADLGIDFEEKAFYDILKAITKKYEFEYPEEKLIPLSKAVKDGVDDKTKYTDWDNREDIKAELKVDLIMLLAPFGVFALIAGTITEVTGDNPAGILELLAALGMYCATVVFGLGVHMMVTYGLILRFLTPISIGTFYRAMAPAQLLAFSTSSSTATLPVTMERAEEKLGVSEEVSSFVLPLGATVNMDGTALYLAVAAVFIGDALGMDLNFSAQLIIVMTAVLASIGAAAVPSAGLIMLVIVLEAIGVPAAGIALILGVDRILDMCRTVTNITGDATVAAVVAASEGELRGVDLSEKADRIRGMGV